MSRSRIRVVILGLIAAVAASLGASQGAMAQSLNGPANNGGKGPGIPGKMNSTTKAERWAAATRSADRRAAKLRVSMTSKGK